MRQLLSDKYFSTYIQVASEYTSTSISSNFAYENPPVSHFLWVSSQLLQSHFLMIIFPVAYEYPSTLNIFPVTSEYFAP